VIFFWNFWIFFFEKNIFLRICFFAVFEIFFLKKPPKSYKDVQNSDPVYGFYTQLSTDEWWRKTFTKTLLDLIDPNYNQSDFEV